MYVIYKAKIGIGIVEILGDGGICACFGFANEVVDVVFGAAGLGVIFGIGGNFNMEVVAIFVFDEFINKILK